MKARIGFSLGLALASAILLTSASNAEWVEVGPKATGCVVLPAGYRCSSGTQIRFGYPREWHALDSAVNGTLYSTLTWLSTQELDEPCSFLNTDTGVQAHCRSPVKRLDSNGALAQWGFGGRPGWSLSQVSGSSLRVGGHRAKLAVRAPGPAADECRQVGGDELVNVWIVRRVPHNYYAMIACLRGPELEALEHKIRTMLRTAGFPFG